MVTRQQLINDNKKRVEAEQRKTEEQRHISAAYTSKQLKEDLKRVNTLVSSDLGNVLLEWNRHGVNSISIQQYQTLAYRKGFWGTLYSNFRLGFTPNPEYTPTKVLIKRLKMAGFTVKAIVEMEQN